MHHPYKTVVVLFLLNIFLLLKLSDGRTLSKRSPQLSLTIIDEPDTTPREHPPTVEDLEERRKALVKALIPGDGSGGGALGGQLQTLTDLGLDIVGGSAMNAGQLFAPLINATRKATENFPRAGDVLNRVIDSARDYRQQARGALRETASSKVNNGIRIFTTTVARGTEVLQGVFKLLRSLLDNFTLAIQNLARTLSRGLARFAETKTRFLSTNFQRVRNLLSNQKLFQPARDAAELGGNLVRGLAQDFTQFQPLVSDGIKTKLTAGARLVPRVRLSTILAPLGDPENKPCADDDGAIINIAAESESDGGYGKKRDEMPGKASSDEIPKDVLELLGSSKSEKQAKPDGTSTTPPTSQEIKSEKPATTTIPPTAATTLKIKSTTSKSSTKEQKSSSIEDLFGISSNST